jgi:signal transduction histidine kinase
VIITDEAGRMVETNQTTSDIWGGSIPLAQEIEDYGRYKAWWADNGIPLKAGDWPNLRVLAEGTPSLGNVLDIEGFDGRRGTVVMSAAPLKGAGGKILGAAVVVQDITRQRELEQEALEAKRRAELYVDLLVHDINNLNATAMGYLQLIQEGSDLKLKYQRMVEKSLEALNDSTRLTETVQKLQTLESEELKRGLVDLVSMLEDVKLEYEAIPGREVNIKLHPTPKRLVQGSALIKDIFMNIVGNAIKHSTGAVAIEIELSSTLHKGKEYHRISIADDGPGIPDEMKTNIFSRLQRGKTKASGKGLGLYLVKRLVEDAGGMVWVEDRVPGDHSQGAKFVVMLPSVAPSTIPPEIPPVE